MRLLSWYPYRFGPRRPASLAMGCAVCFLATVIPSRPSHVETMAHPATDNAAPDCAATRGGRRLTYSNPRWGFTLSYPSTFVLDPESVPETGASARFSTPDGRATAVVTGLRNGM